MNRLVVFAAAALTAVSAVAQTTEGSIKAFRRPATEIEAITMASPLPSTYFNGSYTKAVVGTVECRSISIEELALHEIRLGGIRINPDNFSTTRDAFLDHIEILNVASGSTVQVSGMPYAARIRNISWSPDGTWFCFTNVTPESVDLYKVDATSAAPAAVKINTARLNATFGTPYIILNNSQILYKTVPAGHTSTPRQAVAKASVVQETGGVRKSGMRTYEDLLTGPFDEDLFDYCCTSILAVYSQEGTKMIGEPAIYRSILPSPDGQYLMTTTEHHPYSYMETHRSFPSRQFIMDLNGNMVKMITDGTKKEEPGKRDSKAPRPMGFTWRSDLPATLVWTESKSMGGFGAPGAGQRPDAAAADKKDDKKEKKPEATHTEKMYQCNAPFNFETDKTVVLAPEFRMGRVIWGNEGFAIYTETSTDQKIRKTMTFVPCDTLAAKKVLFTESTERDSLGTFPVIGSPYTVRNQYGSSVVWTDEKHTTVYLTGTRRRDAEGYYISFLDKVGVNDGKISNVWTENNKGQKESLVAISSFAKTPKIIVTREAFDVVPDYWEADTRNSKSRRITSFRNPVPQVAELITKQHVTYTRKDGLKCYGSLYLPKGYNKERDGKLPVLMWTYPYEYTSFVESEKQRPDRHKFLKPSYGSAQIWATQGYAVLDDFTMSIISEHPDSLPNNRFLEQLVMNAESAIDFVADSLGIGDRDRVAVGGHSYGGFMTANLLAHTRLFKAGIARSGAYMRSLTPFGFQSERRNYWKAKDVYDQMSPFNYADKVKDNLLIIHGQLDDNMGTFPVQSERLYQALVYFGAPARYVQLPYEAHSYIGKETTLDMLYETGAWLDKYVKNYKPKAKPEGKPAGEKKED